MIAMKKRYRNPYIHNVRRKWYDFILWQLGYYDDMLPISIPPENFSYPIPKVATDISKPVVSWVNHSTFIVKCNNITILTDPIWSERCSPIPLLGPKRQHHPPVAIEELDKIDIVLISHNHYDHLDYKTVRKLHRRFPDLLWYVPFGVKKWFSACNIKNVKELHWWEESCISLDDGNHLLKVTSVPAQHNSGRGFFDTDATLWMGFVVEFFTNEELVKCFYFVGDTAYNPYDFKKIGERFASIDLCLCPIGTYKPGRFMRTVHSSPEDAVNIHLDVKAALSVGMHWKTFKLSSEHRAQPPYDLFLEMTKRGLNPTHFLAVEPGVPLHW